MKKRIFTIKLQMKLQMKFKDDKASPAYTGRGRF
uniref:Uncharacterized protein n=2 Tax=unclassified Caudoviricetes TaxID=2788787 RepID=A0A8S5VFD9_9CAUD|nr:MAG TPA: hypothetical protein [Siphoviridae sp. ctu1o13]DAG05474.1 MAG TPA: hypothetical protein [Siphoviridae sp. ct1da40]